MSHSFNLGYQHDDGLLCNECNKVFKSERSLYAHKKEMHPSAPEVHLCPECGAGFGRKSNMRAHRKEKHSGMADVHSCPECKKTFTRKSNLRAHMRVFCRVGEMRPEEPKPPLTYSHDHQNLADSDTASDTKSDTCHTTVGAVESWQLGKEDIQEKAQMPVDEEFQCSFCDFKSSAKSASSAEESLSRHIKTVHEKIRDKKCSMCDFAATDTRVVARHMERQHAAANGMDDTAKISQENGAEECRIGGKASCDKHSWKDQDGSNTGTSNAPQLDLSEAVAAIGDMGLTSVNVGDYLIILNKNIDVAVDGEPYISFMLFYDTMSGRFFKRIWNKTVASGKTTDIATLVKVSKAYFNRGKPCLALVKYDGQNEMPEDVTSACHSFSTKNHDSEVEMCSECKKTRDTIDNGMREAEDIKMEDFEDVNNDGQCEEAFDDAVCKDDVEVGNSDTSSCEQLLELRENLLSEKRINLANKVGQIDDVKDKEQPKPPVRPTLSYKELIAEALEDGKMLNLDEIINSISQKHTYFNVSDAGLKKSFKQVLPGHFELVDRRNKNPSSRLWRLITSNEAYIKCDYCDERFLEGNMNIKQKRGAKYKYHLQYEHGWNSNNFHCPGCDFKANLPIKLVEHMEQMGHKDTTVACPVCNDSFDKTEIVSHSRLCNRKKARVDINRRQINNDPCPTCGKVLKSKKSYARHLLVHLRQQGEQDPVLLEPHNRVKKNLYFYCDKCEKKFAQSLTLKYHIQAVHEGKGFKCDICSVTLENYTYLRKHKYFEHSIGNLGKTYECKFCGKRLFSLSRFKVHERQHLEPQFQCSICAKRLMSETNLIAHERAHRGEKPFDCSTCGAGFTSLHGLQQHKSGVHKISGPQGRKTGWSRKRKLCTDENK